ncbi:uncharacterized protein LOC123565277 [Mercenaria mercenaria]|uniref:uncharacterized protein LOC123565277 n=1 Tax=Mercenaria mercenaria TaxID=6596 RepID=UPI00234F06A4|nr:uncharacterized protein LOC123565277 [Mercenaria mercenaria]XP_053406109.1 uncharacterized protein LOC123565277 [Mercenaria mercenaria]XP_053406110.1 uncharacterized protein LOC123565277 [Mercenaria mercenaria]XP_053406111.1 uncharacterized protein LOC123565277 [Mercenaria mercenaria]
MLRTRLQGDDNMFRWARTEMKRELVMSQSSYAKVAGLQSEVGRVVITRVAGSELEYKRTLNMYRKDVTCTVNNIRREQIKMRMKLGRYVRKLKQTRIEHAKLIKEQQRRDKERALLEELHLRLKYEATARTPEPEDIPTEDHILHAHETDQSVHGDEEAYEHVNPPTIDFKSGSMFLQTGMNNAELGNSDSKDEDKLNPSSTRIRKASHAFEPMLPMINEDAEKECDESTEKVGGAKDESEPDRFDLRVWDEDMSVSSYGGRIKRKNDVSFSDIIKLKYTGTKNLFDVVHRLARKHGIPDVEETVPDPRDNIVHRGATNDSLKLQAAVLYPMKYGYNPEEETNEHELDRLVADNSKSPAITDSEHDTMSDHRDSVSANEQKFKRMRRLSLRHSRSVDEGEDYDYYLDVPDQPRKLKSRDLSMPELVDKVRKIKLEQVDRLSSSQRLENEMISSYNLLSPSPSYKPSSSRSSRSLPAISKHSGKEDKNNVTWTQAFGLLRAIHSLEDVSA